MDWAAKTSADRHRAILEHVARYRLTTLDALQRATLPRLSHNAVAKRAARLCDEAWLAKFPLVHPRQYFVLGAAGARALGIRAHRTAPLGPQTLPIQYALLVHAIYSAGSRIRLTAGEVRRGWPWLTANLADAPHCLARDAGVLELVRVDLGGPADHVARKTAHDLRRRRRLPEFLALVAQGRFRLVLVTTTRDKARAIRAAIARHDFPPGLRWHYAIVPQLLTLTSRHSRA